MLHHAVRPLLRLTLLSVLLGAMPPAPLPLARATADRPAAVAGPPVAATRTASAPSASSAAPDSTPVPHPEPPPPSMPARAPIAPAATPNLGKLPLAFVPNDGQTDPSVKFHARGLGGTLFFTAGDLIMRLPSSPGICDAVAMPILAGRSPSTAVAMLMLPGRPIRITSQQRPPMPSSRPMAAAAMMCL